MSKPKRIYPNISITGNTTGKKKQSQKAIDIYVNATYKQIKKGCPKCGAPQIEFTRGDGLKRYWCTEIMCDYIEPKKIIKRRK